MAVLPNLLHQSKHTHTHQPLARGPAFALLGGTPRPTWTPCGPAPLPNVVVTRRKNERCEQQRSVKDYMQTHAIESNVKTIEPNIARIGIIKKFIKNALPPSRIDAVCLFLFQKRKPATNWGRPPMRLSGAAPTLELLMPAQMTQSHTTKHTRRPATTTTLTGL